MHHDIIAVGRNLRDLRDQLGAPGDLCQDQLEGRWPHYTVSLEHLGGCREHMGLLWLNHHARDALFEHAFDQRGRQPSELGQPVG